MDSVQTRGGIDPPAQGRRVFPWTSDEPSSALARIQGIRAERFDRPRSYDAPHSLLHFSVTAEPCLRDAEAVTELC